MQPTIVPNTAQQWHLMLLLLLAVMVGALPGHLERCSAHNFTAKENVEHARAQSLHTLLLPTCKGAIQLSAEFATKCTESHLGLRGHMATKTSHSPKLQLSKNSRKSNKTMQGLLRKMPTSKRPSGHFHIDIYNLDGSLNLKLD